MLSQDYYVMLLLYCTSQFKTVAGLAPNDQHGNFQQPKTGVYTITDPCTASTRSVFTEVGRSDARCDMDRGNGGWLVIQRRVAGGTENFYRGWSDYEEGFGDLEGEFWYGLKNIHCLTNRESVELRFDLEDESGNKFNRTYQQFRVEGPENKYRLHIGGGDTPAGALDFMAYHNSMYFTTKDRDNDRAGSNCAVTYKGGWWYHNCEYTNPNGPHHVSPTHFGLNARLASTALSSATYLPYYEMKIRSKSFSLFQTNSCT